jgi:alkylated DNA repair protein alkB family protein 1
MAQQQQQQTLFRRVEKSFQQKEVSRSTAGSAKAARRSLVPRERCPPLVDVLSAEPDAQVIELSPVGAVRRFTFAQHEGLVLLSGALLPCEQLRLARRAFVDYAEPPNQSNLSASHDAASLSRLFVRSELEHDAAAADLLASRRWVTLGYQYDWTRRIYDDAAFEPMPRDLHTLVLSFVRTAFGESQAYEAEAAIVNYYFADSSLCGHLDDAERFLDAPIVSISLGLDCVFLIGGPTRDIAPTPLLLRSGDVVLMGGASRRSYHGVPRIFADSFATDGGEEAISQLSSSVVGETERAREVALLRSVWTRLRSTRINLNVRQVNAVQR